MACDLSVEIAGVRLKFPTALGSGILTKDGESMKRAARHYGVGAVISKTAVPVPPAIDAWVAFSKVSPYIPWT